MISRTTHTKQELARWLKTAEAERELEEAEKKVAYMATTEAVRAADAAAARYYRALEAA
jgi:hypothetical protein